MDASRLCRSRRRLRNSRLVHGSAWLICCATWSCGATIPDGHDGWFFNGLLVLTIGDGAHPGSRRLIPGLQPPMAERTGSRHARSSFHPPTRLARSRFHCGWTAHNPLRRGRPLRRPVLPDSYIHFGRCFRGQACKPYPTATASPHSSHYSPHPQRGRRCTNPPRHKHQWQLKGETHPRQVRRLAWRTASGG